MMQLPHKITNWTTFWQANPTGFNKVMQKSTSFFAKKMRSVFDLNQTDNILDFGCGPGYLIELINEEVNSIHGVDISNKYIELCNTKFCNQKNISVSQINAHYSLFPIKRIKGLPINKIIVLSVLQYYPSLDAVKDLLNDLKRNTPSGTQCLIADIIPPNHHFFNDALSVFINSIKQNYFLSFLRFMFYVTFSNYKNLNQEILKIDKHFFVEYAKNIDVEILFIPAITLHPNRYSLIIKF